MGHRGRPKHGAPQAPNFFFSFTAAKGGAEEKSRRRRVFCEYIVTALNNLKKIGKIVNNFHDHFRNSWIILGTAGLFEQ